MSSSSGVEVVHEGEQLSIIGQGIVFVPPDIGQKYAAAVTTLDLSHNELTAVGGEVLQQFKNLKTLVLDGNSLESHQEWPKLTTLTSLSINSNKIEDLKVFLDDIEKAFPNLTFLSLLKNSACPNFFTGKDQDDYQRYRYYVLHRIRTLKFLDSSPVTDAERKESARVGYLMEPKPAAVVVQTPAVAPPPEDESTLPRPLPADTTRAGAPGPASFGKTRYVYYGKQSEGNRFILNQDL